MMRETKIILLSVLAGFIFTVCAELAGYSEKTQSDISNQVLRFHVLANSDNPSDQALKLKVKEQILDEYGDALRQSNSLDSTKSFITEHSSEIQTVAESVVNREGYDYPVKVSLTSDFFPTKTYGDMTFPSGEYDALRIELGNAEGQNWWCMLFPPLCFVDVAKGDEAKNDLKDILTDDEYELIVSDTVSVKIKFKIVELWQKAKKSGFKFAFWEG